MRGLDIGAGHSTYDYAGEVVKLDIREDIGADVVMDITSPAFTEWRPEPFNNIWMRHVLEHLNVAHVKAVLKKCHDLLVGGGQMDIAVPDMLWCARKIVESEMLDLPAIGFIYGGDSPIMMHHRCGFTRPMLLALLSEAGFADVKGRSEPFNVELTYQDGSLDIVEMMQLRVIGTKHAD